MRPAEFRRRRSSTIFRPAERLGEGGEARVYVLPGDVTRVVKIYHRPTLEHERKLSSMIANTPRDPAAAQGHTAIVWPEDIVERAANRAFAGFVMPRALHMLNVSDVYTPKVRRQKAPGFTYRYLHRAAQNLAAAVNEIHRAGYVIGDVNESN